MSECVVIHRIPQQVLPNSQVPLPKPNSIPSQEDMAMIQTLFESIQRRASVALILTSALVVSFSLSLPTPSFAGTATCGTPKHNGQIKVKIFISVDPKNQHGIPVTKTVDIDGTWSAAKKAEEIAKALRADVQRNGATITANGATVTVTNNNPAWKAFIELTNDTSGEFDKTDHDEDGDSIGDPEDIAYQTTITLSGTPTTSGSVTVGENGLTTTVLTEPSMGISDMYLNLQSALGGTIQSEGLVLPVNTYPSNLPYSMSFEYEATDPGLGIQVKQRPLFDWRDLIGTDTRLTVTDQGMFGFMDNSLEAGTGFVYPADGLNHLFVGSVWLGLNPTDILNRDYDPDPLADWAVSADPVGHPEYDQLSSLGQEIKTEIVALSLEGNSFPTVVGVSSYDLGDAPSDFMILKVRTTCEGPMPAVGAYSGLFFDFDVNGTYDQDTGAVELSSNVAWMTSSEPGAPYIGLAVASTGEGCVPELPINVSMIPNPLYIWPDGYMLDENKWGFMTAAGPEYQVFAAPTPDDYSVIASAGPFDLFPGESREMTYVLAAGDTFEDMLANIAVANEIACSGGLTPADAPEHVAELESAVTVSVHPNPARGAVQMSFQTTQRGDVSVDLFDSSGRRVRSFEGATASAGLHSFRWNGLDDRGNALPAGTYYARVRTPDGTASAQVTLIR